MSDTQQQSGPTTQAGPSEDEMRAAYEAELNRISSSEMILQTAVSLLNIGGRRLGLAPTAPSGEPGAGASPPASRDLEQVRDAIDGASALLPILERRMPGELGPLRDAIAQLQVAYAREAQNASGGAPTASQAAQPGQQPKAPESDPSARQDGDEVKQQQSPGPAQASGRLWVPGR